MRYEIVNLEEKIIVGLSAVTSNEDPNMGKTMGGLWGKLYEGGINETIKNKVNKYAVGLYSDYEDDKYLVTVGNEVLKAENEGLTIKKIPAGKYAKFSIEGHMEKAVAKAWSEIWQMDIDRSYKADFEEYLNSDFNNAKIDIYISLK